MGVTLYKGTQQSIDYALHEIHAGRAFFYTVSSLTLTADTEINITFTTPNTAARLHIIFAYSCTQPATFTILEGPTVEADSGTETAPYNHDRNSATTSGILDLETAPVANRLSYNATIDAPGTVLFTDLCGTDKQENVKIALGQRDELILKQNTTYAFRLLRDSTVATGYGVIYVTWYEG